MYMILATGSTGLAETFGTALTTIQSDIMSYVGVAAPVALGIAGVFIAIRLGFKFFRSVAK